MNLAVGFPYEFFHETLDDIEKAIEDKKQQRDRVRIKQLIDNLKKHAEIPGKDLSEEERAMIEIHNSTRKFEDAVVKVGQMLQDYLHVINDKGADSINARRERNEMLLLLAGAKKIRAKINRNLDILRNLAKKEKKDLK